MRYSPTKKCFYPESVSYPKGALPSDLISVSDADHRAALARSPNTTFEFSSSGKLTIVASGEQPTHGEIEAAQLKSDALEALKKSDVTVLRCLEHGVQIPAAWVEYRTELRQVANGELATMPTQPDFPAGT
jgi:hypothetical protein